MILRIIDKTTNLFVRDDFNYNPETEIGLEAEPSQGLRLPRWNGETWEEGMTPEQIAAIPKPIEELSIEDMVITLEDVVLEILMM